MNNKRATKRALLTSVMALVMCVVMLAGTTFAWFTDTASTGVNKIQAGNLDVELAYKNAETMTTDTGFKAANKDTPVFKEGALWEPGHVEYVVLKISNAGNLALKYKLGINIASETGSTNVLGNEFNLSDYIKFAVIDGDKSGLDRDALVAEAGEGAVLSTGYTAEDHLLKDGIKTVTLVVWMPKSVGNEANYDAAVAEAPVINLGINVVATQYTYESDSFDGTYDKNAQYPEVSYAQVSSQDDLNSALTNPTDANGNPTTKVAVELKKDGTYTLPVELQDKDITVIGTKDTVVNMANNDCYHADNVSLEGVTVAFANEDYRGFKHAGKLTYKDCTITGKQFLYANDVEFINCTFVQDAVDYNVWTYGAGSVLFKDCNFDCKGKAVLIYNEGTLAAQNVEFQNCKFNASAPVADKAAIEIDCTFTSYNVVIDKATADSVAGFGSGSVSGSSVWNVKKGDKPTTVTVAGTVVYSK